jgi:hypothetical protein
MKYEIVLDFEVDEEDIHKWPSLLAEAIVDGASSINGSAFIYSID